MSTPSTVEPHGVPQKLTLEEVAAIHRVCTRTIRNWVKAGTFPPPVRYGLRLLWDRRDILRAAPGGGRGCQADGSRAG
jgi:predicted DNA-binding transcriptional regulator AlpA